MKYLLSLLFLLAGSAPLYAETQELLNVSYDPTRELYEEYNALFVKHWKEQSGNDIRVEQSHGGSGKQARAVIEGLKADVVTLALAYDIDMIAKKSGLLPADWQEKLPHHSSPYHSTIVFLVREGNPKHIKDWDDLVNPGIEVITPNPKTSGGARWNYLAAWGYAREKLGENGAKDFIAKLYRNVPVLDTGARGATITFVERGIGEVLIAWENEAYLARAMSKQRLEIIYPSVSILTEPPVAVVEKNAESKGNLAAAQEYVRYLYSPDAQEIIAKHYYRPVDEQVAARYNKTFPSVRTFTIADFGGWEKAQNTHFADGGTFDQIYH